MKRETSLACGCVAFAAVLNLCVQGYQFGHGNHTVYLLDALHRASPGILSNDWFTTRTFQYHALFGWAAAELMRAGIIAPAFLVGYLILVAALHVAWWRIVRSLGGGAVEFIVSEVLFQLAAGGTGLGMYQFLQDSSFLPSNVSAVAMLWAIALWLGESQIGCGIALGIAAALHLNYAPVGILLWTLLQACEVRRRDNRERFGWRFWIGGACAIVPAAVNVLFALKQTAGRRGAMPLVEFVDLYVRLRHPHHYDPSTWPAWLWISFLVPMPGAIAWWVWQQRAGKSSDARQYAARVFYIFSLLTIVALIGAGLTYLSEEIMQASLYRFSIYPKMLGCVGSAFLLREFAARRRFETMLTISAFGIGVVLMSLYTVRGPYLGLYRWADGEPSYSLACDWIREHTPVDAVFVVAPSEQEFRLRAQRAIVVNFKCVPQLSGELGEWRDRLQAVLDLPDLRTLPHSFDKALVAMRERYEAVDPQRLADAADKYGAQYILVEHSFGPSWEPRRIEMDGNTSWFLYDLWRENDAGREPAATKSAETIRPARRAADA